MLPIDLFRFCPRCASACEPGRNPFACTACGFTYHFNPTVSAAAFVFDADGRALFVRRAKDPAKGMLGLPGGFIDIGERAEDALRREVREEVNLEIDRVTFLGSWTNEYPYRGVTYPVCDLIFTAVAVDPAAAQSLDDVDGYEWRAVAEVEEEELAFTSMRAGLRVLKSRFS